MLTHAVILSKLALSLSFSVYIEQGRSESRKISSGGILSEIGSRENEDGNASAGNGGRKERGWRSRSIYIC
jgi:hypothetical protein